WRSCNSGKRLCSQSDCSTKCRFPNGSQRSPAQPHRRWHSCSRYGDREACVGESGRRSLPTKEQLTIASSRPRVGHGKVVNIQLLDLRFGVLQLARWNYSSSWNVRAHRGTVLRSVNVEVDVVGTVVGDLESVKIRINCCPPAAGRRTTSAFCHSRPVGCAACTDV